MLIPFYGEIHTIMEHIAHRFGKLVLTNVPSQFFSVSSKSGTPAAQPPAQASPQGLSASLPPKAAAGAARLPAAAPRLRQLFSFWVRRAPPSQRAF